MKALKFFIIAFIQLQIKSISEWFFYRGKQLSFERAKRLARRKYAVKKMDYYVIEGDRWIFFVGSSLEIDKLRRVHVFGKDIDAKKLNQICCFKIGQTCPNGTDYSHRLTFADKLK